MVVGLVALVASWFRLPETLRPEYRQPLHIGSILRRFGELFRHRAFIGYALTGNVAKLLATLAVIVTGMAWMFGYLDLRKAGYVIFGVAILFGASEIVSTITGK